MWHGLTGHGLALACGDCAGTHQLPESPPLIVVALMAFFALIGGAIIAWQLRSGHRAPPITDQWSAMVAMGELCPSGWRAEIKLDGARELLSEDHVSSGVPPIVVDWGLYEQGSNRITITRRVSVDTLDHALQAMVDDRRLDIMLGQIEQSASKKDRI